MKILVIEDEVEICNLIGDYCNGQGHSVELAHSGIEALSKLETETFELVITDIKLVKINGAQIIKWIGKNRPDTRIVAMSGYTKLIDDLNRDKDFERIGIKILPKPFLLQDLNNMILQFQNSRPVH